MTSLKQLQRLGTTTGQRGKVIEAWLVYVNPIEAGGGFGGPAQLYS